MGHVWHENWWVKTEVLREKPMSVPLCSPQIPHTLLREWIWACAVRRWEQTAWAVAQPDGLVMRYWCTVYGYFCTFYGAAVMCDALWLSGRYMFFIVQHCISMKVNYRLSQLCALCYIKSYRVVTWHGISNNNCKIILICSELPFVT